MAKYLDGTGLGKLWTTATGAFIQKNGGGQLYNGSIIGGANLNICGNGQSMYLGNINNDEYINIIEDTKVGRHLCFYDRSYESDMTSDSYADVYYSFNTDLLVVGNAQGICANSFIKAGGTASQFLKADGSVDSYKYAFIQGSTILYNFNKPLGGYNPTVGEIAALSGSANPSSRIYMANKYISAYDTISGSLYSAISGSSHSASMTVTISGSVSPRPGDLIVVNNIVKYINAITNVSGNIYGITASSGFTSNISVGTTVVFHRMYKSASGTSYGDTVTSAILGECSIINGNYNFSFGDYNNIFGEYNKIFGSNRLVVGTGLTDSTAAAGTAPAIGNNATIIVGKYNTYSNVGSSVIVAGYGTQTSRNTIFRVTTGGATYADSSYYNSGADYAEYFEWADGNVEEEDRVGLFVALVEDKIKVAAPGDDVIGVISGCSTVIGNGDNSKWVKKYLNDIYGRPIMEEIEEDVKVGTNEEGNPITEKQKRMTRKQNPDFDETREYISREDRPEWDVVGLLGQLVVRDDGTCLPGKRCSVAEGGIATLGSDYRVMKRLDENHIRILASFL